MHVEMQSGRLELILAKKDVKWKKGFHSYGSNKQKHWEDVGPLLSRAGKLAANTGAAEVLNTFFASEFTVIDRIK